MVGVPGPRLSPEFVPVIESTEFGRSLPRRVASATASRICCRIQIWLAPTGVCTSKGGMPVSWQIAPSWSDARSMFCAMIVSACDERVPSGSLTSAVFMAARTSGGSSVEVFTISCRTLSKKLGSITTQYTWGLGDWGLRPTCDLELVTSDFRTERDPLGEL